MRRKRRSTPSPAQVGAVVSAAGLAAGAALWRVAKRRRGAPEPGPQVWTCACGQELRVTGEDRHRIYWLPDAPLSEPLMARTCPSCDRALP